MSHEVGYFQAWEMWLNGETLSQHFLWGVKIIWWGRIGKIVQFVSIVGLIPDIVGEERLRSLYSDFLRRYAQAGALRSAMKWMQGVLEELEAEL